MKKKQQSSRLLSILTKISEIKIKSVWILMPIALSSVLLWGWLSRSVDSNIWSVEYLEQIIKNSGWFAPAVYISLIALSVVISPIPGSCFAIVAGKLWNPITGGIYTVIGGFIGSTIAYFIGRKFGEQGIKALTGKKINFEKNQKNIYISGLIFLSRLVPIVPFDLMSYGAGVIKIPFPMYAIATLLGMIPSTFLITYIGGSISLNWTYALKFAAPVVIIVILGRIALKSFNPKIKSNFLHFKSNYLFYSLQEEKKNPSLAKNRSLD